MRRILTLVSLSALLAVSLSACLMPPTAPVVTEERDVDTVAAVVFNSSGELIISVGEPSLTITGPADALERITSESGDDLLVIAATGSGVSWGDLRYELSMPALTTVRVSGSGDVEVDFSTADDVSVSLEGSGDLEGSGIDAATISVTVSGSGAVSLAGTAVGVSVRLDGSGEVDLSEVVASDAFVTLDGSGEVTVHATRMLRADVGGSGTVHHSGGADVTSTVTGSGEVVAD